MRRDHKVPGGWKEAGEDVEAVSDGWKTAEEGDLNIPAGWKQGCHQDMKLDAKGVRDTRGKIVGKFLSSPLDQNFIWKFIADNDLLIMRWRS